jgi:hypothetical protein
MFKIYPNHNEVNNLKQILESVFDFKTFKETNTYVNDKDYGSTIYSMAAENGWSCITSFVNKEKKAPVQKHYCPEIIFVKTEKHNRDYQVHLEELKQTNKKVADYLTKLHKPNYEQLFHILDMFVKTGVDSGMLKNIELKTYRKHLKSHIGIVYHKHSLEFNDRNLGIINFNEILQDNSMYNEGFFKQSYVTLSVIYLADRDNTLKPYFKLRLPYAENKKGTCIFSLSDKSKVYFTYNDSDYMNGYIDELTEFATDDESLKLILEYNFLKEIKTTISKTLKIDKKELDKLSVAELKSYFVVFEMYKI